MTGNLQMPLGSLLESDTLRNSSSSPSKMGLTFSSDSFKLNFLPVHLTTLSLILFTKQPREHQWRRNLWI